MMYQNTVLFDGLEDAIEELMKEGYTIIYIEKWTNEWNVAYWKMGKYTQDHGGDIYTTIPDLSKSPEELYEQHKLLPTFCRICHKPRQDTSAELCSSCQEKQ